MKPVLFLCLFLSVLSPTQIYAQQPVSAPVLSLAQPLKDSLHLRPYISVFADKKSRYSFQDAQNQTFISIDSFKPDSKFQAGRYVYWYRFKVENTTSDTIKLSLNLPRLDSVSIYPTPYGTPLQIGSTVKRHPQSEKRGYPSNRTALLYFPPNKTQEYYFRYHNQISYREEIKPILFKPESEAGYFIWNLVRYYAWNACFMGILIFAFLTSLFNYGQTRHRAFIYYTGYILAHFAYYWMYLGNNDQFIDVSPDWMHDYYFYTPISWSWAFFYLLFLMSFFESKKEIPQMHRLILIALYGFLILLLIDRILISIDYQTAWQGTYVARYMLNIGGIVLLVYMFLKFKVNRLEGYILIGTFCYALGGLGTRLAQDTSPVWDDGLVYHQLGVLFELLFFSMGLAYKFRLDAIDKERYMLENQRLELERALSLANLRNQIAQDIHDEIGAGLTKISLAAQFTLRLPNLTMTDVREKIKRLETETRHLAAKLREIVFAINPEYDNFEDMQDYFRDAAQQFWAETDIKLVFDFPKRATKYTVAPDVKRHLLLIFTEMQNNIAKHAHATQVDLTLKMVSTTQYTLSIKDNGCGFTLLPKESGQVRKNGFSKGLSGMKSRAESIKADFYIVSEERHGTTITVQGTF